jgi:hypothetical protein
MKAAVTSLLFLLVLAPATARADNAAAVAAGSKWFESLIDWGDLPASKKAPVTYAVVSNHPRCKKLKVGKTTTRKVANQLSLCFPNAYLALIDAESEYVPKATGWKIATDVKGSMGSAFNKKQRAAITAAAKDTTIVTNSYQGEHEGEMMQVFIAVAADGSIRAVWLYQSPDTF